MNIPETLTEADKPNAAISSSNGIILVFGSRTITIPPSHPNYEAIREELEDTPVDFEYILTIADIPRALNQFIEEARANTSLMVDTLRKVVTYDGRDLPSMFAEKLLKLMRHDMAPTTIINFLQKLYSNKTPSVIEDLLPFCSVNNFMLWDDGDILGFKSVREDFKDHHSGRFNNTPGNICRMPREEVNVDRYSPCSHGLHVAARVYAENFNSYKSRLLVVKVDPRHVVAIPIDHDQQKMRCCEYMSISEIGKDQNLPNNIGVFSPIDFELAQKLVINHQD